MLIQSDCCLCKRRELPGTCAHGGKTLWEDSNLQVKERGLRKKSTLPIPLTWTVSLQNCEKINFSFLSIPSLWYFAMAILENEPQWLTHSFWNLFSHGLKSCFTRESGLEGNRIKGELILLNIQHPKANWGLAQAKLSKIVVLLMLR